MFGVGLHFSLRRSLSVKAIAVPGALGADRRRDRRWATGSALARPAADGSLVFGLALSVASTVVLLRALQERHLVETERGRIAVGWLIVEDLAMVLALVLLPVVAASSPAPATAGGVRPTSRCRSPSRWQGGGLRGADAGGRPSGHPLGAALGRRHGSRELFTLAVLALALGVAFGRPSCSASPSPSAPSSPAWCWRVRAQPPRRRGSLPLRDAFAVLFFVSVGMLFDPAVLVDRRWRCWRRCSSSSSASPRRLPHRAPSGIRRPGADHLRQPGADRRVLLHPGRPRRRARLLLPETQDLILAGAILSIVVNPFLFTLLDRLEARRSGRRRRARKGELIASSIASGHAVIVGYGRSGRTSSTTSGRRNGRSSWSTIARRRSPGCGPRASRR